MINKVKTFFKFHTNTNPSFYELPAREKKRIIEFALRGANEMQLAIVKEYDRKFGK